MTALARIITIGRNDQLPKVGRIHIGVRVDGTAVTAPVYLRPNEEVCRGCAGSGWITASPTNPSERECEETCTLCEGEGIITTGEDE